MSLPRFITDRQAELSAICVSHGAVRLALFGSASRDDFSFEKSDLDFLVALDDGGPPGLYATRFFGLKQSLEALFERPVDLLSEGSIQNPYLRQRINAERTPVYGA